jgi:GT2 family glycosyltransferase
MDHGQVMHESISFISGCLWLIPSKTFDKVDFINEDYFMYVEDLEFCHRVLKSSLRLVVNGECKIYHKVGGASGHWSVFASYWMSRNKMRFLWENMSPLKRVYPMVYQAIYMAVWWLFKRRADLFSAHVKGVFDFLRK